MRTSAAFAPADPTTVAHGAMGAFVGHFARANPHLEQLQRNPHALCICLVEAAQ